MSRKLKISKQAWEKIFDYYEKAYGGVVPRSVPIKDFARQRVDSAFNQLQRLEKLNIRKSAVCLDAGCGIGAFLTLANLSGYNFYGYDVNKDALEIAKLIMKSNGISDKKIDSKPTKFKKNFDWIISFEVVEHLDNTQNYIHSLKKLLNQNGRMFIETPNYLIPYEPHFYLFLPPGPRWFKWLLFQLQGRTNRQFFYELNFENNYHLEKMLKHLNVSFDNLGKEEWAKAFLNSETEKRSRYVKAFFKWMKKLKLINLITTLTNLGLYTPLIYVCSSKSKKN